MKPKITDELLDELLKNYSQPGDLLGPDGLLTELKKRLINRVLDSELTTHLGYELKAGERLKLRHRFLFHKGDEKAAKIAEAFEVYAK